MANNRAIIVLSLLAINVAGLNGKSAVTISISIYKFNFQISCWKTTQKLWQDNGLHAGSLDGFVLLSGKTEQLEALEHGNGNKPTLRSNQGGRSLAADVRNAQTTWVYEDLSECN